MKTVFISGTSKGIGFSLAEHFLNQNWQVLGCSRSESKISHPKYKHFICDLTVNHQIRQMTKDISEQFRSLDVVIHNAALSSMNLALLMTDEKITDIFHTNLIAPFLISRDLSRLLSRSPRGHIIHFSSPVVELRAPGLAAYGATKASLEYLTQVLSQEFAPLKISVNAISPGFVETDMIRNIPVEDQNALMAKARIPNKTSFQQVADTIDRLIQGSETGQILKLGSET